MLLSSYALRPLGANLTLALPRRYYCETPSSSKKPESWHLEHVQNRVVFSTPQFFRQNVDYNIFRKDVVVDDQIFGIQKEGLHQLMSHFHNIAVFGNAVLPYVELEAVQCHPSLEDGTVRLRWRMKYVSYPRLLTDFKLLKRDYREQHTAWYDGYSVFSVDGKGDVYKLTIQKTIKDESGRLVDAKKALKEKLAVFIPQQPKGAVNFMKRDDLDQKVKATLKSK